MSRIRGLGIVIVIAVAGAYLALTLSANGEGGADSQQAGATSRDRAIGWSFKATLVESSESRVAIKIQATKVRRGAEPFRLNTNLTTVPREAYPFSLVPKRSDPPRFGASATKTFSFHQVGDGGTGDTRERLILQAAALGLEKKSGELHFSWPAG